MHKRVSDRSDHENFCTAVRVVSHKTWQLLEWFGTADTPRASLHRLGNRVRVTEVVVLFL